MNLGATKLNEFVVAEQWDHATERCKSHSQEAKAWSACPGFFEGKKTSDLLPIHQACHLRAPMKVMQALVFAYPEGVEAKESSYRRLPVHISCRAGAAFDIVKFLLEQYPDGSGVADSMGRIALHYACSNGAATQTIVALLKACPGAARAPDNLGWLPLHVACSVGMSSDAIRVLAESYPESTFIRTKKGWTPAMCTSMMDSPNKAEILSILEEESKKCKPLPPAPDGSVAKGDHEKNKAKKVLPKASSAEYV